MIDIGGGAVSLVCAVHCLATPFVLTSLPALGGSFAHPAAHWVLIALAAPLAFVGVVYGYRRHGKLLAPVLITLGLGLIFFATAKPAFASSPTPEISSTHVADVGDTATADSGHVGCPHCASAHVSTDGVSEPKGVVIAGLSGLTMANIAGG
ncbi:MAG: MerC domain-containing protein, partial [Planctomycetota bacterium]